VGSESSTWRAGARQAEPDANPGRIRNINSIAFKGKEMTDDGTQKHDVMQPVTLREKVNIYADRMGRFCAFAGVFVGFPAMGIAHFFFQYGTQELVRILDIFTVPLVLFVAVAFVTKSNRK
jgi:hypothetical protein